MSKGVIKGELNQVGSSEDKVAFCRMTHGSLAKLMGTLHEEHINASSTSNG